MSPSTTAFATSWSASGFRHRRTGTVGRLLGSLIGALMISAMLTMIPAPGAAAETTGNTDALQARVRAELAVFTDWLQVNGARGYVGEVGWPNNVGTEKWNALARTWYNDAVRAGLWSSAWATGEWWGTNYNLSNYVWATTNGPLGATRPPAQVIEEQNLPEHRSVTLSGAEFGPIGIGLMPTSTLSNANPGTYGRDYHYDSQDSFHYLASRGITTIRLAFRWERIQPVLGGALDATELQRLTDAVAKARAAGLKVILDVHNYGAYWLSDGTQGVRRALGSAQLPQRHFTDLWSRLSAQFRDNPGVLAYGLMNEPVGMAAANGFSAAQLWEQASQAALNSIRANGDTKLVMVPGYQWSGVKQWATQHPRGWITDPASGFRYEAHHYWDGDNSGTYTRSYQDEVAAAEAAGYRASPISTTTTSTSASSTTTSPSSTTIADTTPPTAPTSLIASAGKRKASLSWTGSSDSGPSGLAGYEVYRSSSATGVFALVASTKDTSYTDTSLIRSRTYWYYVRALDRAGNASTGSNVVSVKVR